MLTAGKMLITRREKISTNSSKIYGTESSSHQKLNTNMLRTPLNSFSIYKTKIIELIAYWGRLG